VVKLELLAQIINAQAQPTFAIATTFAAQAPPLEHVPTINLHWEYAQLECVHHQHSALLASAAMVQQLVQTVNRLLVIVKLVVHVQELIKCAILASTYVVQVPVQQIQLIPVLVVQATPAHRIQEHAIQGDVVHHLEHVQPVKCLLVNA